MSIKVNKTDSSHIGGAYSQGQLPAGPYLAEVKAYTDPTKNNRVAVTLLNADSSKHKDDPSTWITVTIALPHYGSTTNTSASGQELKSKEAHDGNSSYGLAIPEPDIGTKCLVVFANGNRSQGYIIAFVPDPFQNTTTTGRGIVRPKNRIAFTDADKEEYFNTGAIFPVLERNLKGVLGTNIPAIQKLEWAFDKLMAIILKGQGLLFDTIRGVTTTSIDRQTPKGIIGMSTPGRQIPDPQDDPELLTKFKSNVMELADSELNVTSRKPGHSIVFDDGQLNGDNNLIRLRSGTGHQILMHDTKGLIYIGNAAGTSWVEMTKGGKIDIFASDSVSIHTKGDFNFTADENFNVKAKNINMMATGNTDIVTEGITSIDSVGTIGLRSTGNILQKGALIHMNSAGNLPPEHTGQAIARIPNHEPWGQHEDYEPASFTQEKTAAGLTEQVSVTINANGILVVGTSSTGE